MLATQSFFINDPAQSITTSGTVTSSTYGLYTVLTFTTTSGTNSFNINTGSKTMDILIVAGGGASFNGFGGDASAGGGAGGLLYGTGLSIAAGTYVCVVGAGGSTSGSGSSQTFTAAGNSTITSSAITTQTAIGGGQGGVQSINLTNGLSWGGSGGSGGGGGLGAPNEGDRGSGTQANSSNPVLTAFKNDGTDGSNGNGHSGGGGGAGGQGTVIGSGDYSTTDGSGGIGKTFTDIWQSGAVVYAKGGNGAAPGDGAGSAGALAGDGAIGAGTGTNGAAGANGIIRVRFLT